MVKNLLYKLCFQVFTLSICVLSLKTVHGVVFSQEAEDTEMLAVRSQVSDIIKDRILFNQTLMIRLENQQGSDRETRARVLKEMYEIKLKLPKDERRFNQQYHAILSGVRKDKRFYEFLDAEYMSKPFETLYKVVRIGLIEAVSYPNIGRTLDERGFLKRMLTLLAPHIPLPAYSFYERIRWVNGREGARLPISTTQDQSFYLMTLTKRLDGFRRDVVARGRNASLEMLREFSAEHDRAVNYLGEYERISTDFQFAMPWDKFQMILRGVDIFQSLEEVRERLELLRGQIIGLRAARVMDDEIPEEEDPKLRQAASEITISVPPAPEPSVESFSSARMMVPVTEPTESAGGSTSGVSSSMGVPLVIGSTESEGEATSDVSSEVLVRPSFAQEDRVEADTSSDVPPVQVVRRKLKPTRQSLIERRKTQEMNIRKFLDQVKAMQPIEEMVELVKPRTSTLAPKALKRLNKFIAGTYRYRHESFSAWVKSLNQGREGMDSVDGSQWRVSLFDLDGVEHSSSIHELHTKGVTTLHPISRDNMFFLLQSAGFIKWNR